MDAMYPPELFLWVDHALSPLSYIITFRPDFVFPPQIEREISHARFEFN